MSQPVWAYDIGTFNKPKKANPRAIDFNPAIGINVFKRYGFGTDLNFTFIIFASGIA